MKEITQLNILRVLAASQVFFAHVWFRMPEVVLGLPVGGEVQHALDRSNIGVCLFNMMVGLVLSLGFMKTKTPYTWATAREFYRKRLLRILPLYLLAVVIFTLANLLLLPGETWGGALVKLVRYLFFLQNLSTEAISNNFAALWWMGLLVQFYLAFPLVANAFARWGSLRACLLLCGASWLLGLAVTLVYELARSETTFWAYYLANLNLPWRLPEFVVGMWLGDLVVGRGGDITQACRDRACLLFLAGLLLVGGLLGWLWGPVFLQNLVSNLAWSLAIVALVCLVPALDTISRAAPIRFLARYSYAFYIVHLPILSYLHLLLTGPTDSLGRYLWVLVVCVAAIVPASVLMDQAACRVWPAPRKG